jgi:hypothetical protein
MAPPLRQCWRNAQHKASVVEGHFTQRLFGCGACWHQQAQTCLHLCHILYLVNSFQQSRLQMFMDWR